VDLEVVFDAVLDEGVAVDAEDLEVLRRCVAVFDTGAFDVTAFDADARLPADFFFLAEADFCVPPE
jgi:hypothetical protein